MHWAPPNFLKARGGGWAWQMVSIIPEVNSTDRQESQRLGFIILAPPLTMITLKETLLASTASSVKQGYQSCNTSGTRVSINWVHVQEQNKTKQKIFSLCKGVLSISSILFLSVIITSFPTLIFWVSWKSNSLFYQFYPFTFLSSLYVFQLLAHLAKVFGYSISPFIPEFS